MAARMIGEDSKKQWGEVTSLRRLTITLDPAPIHLTYIFFNNSLYSRHIDTEMQVQVLPINSYANIYSQYFLLALIPIPGWKY